MSGLSKTKHVFLLQYFTIELKGFFKYKYATFMFVSLTKFVHRFSNIKGVVYEHRYVLPWPQLKNKYLTKFLYQRLCISNIY